MQNLVMTPDVARPSVDPALDGGVYGPNVATITASGVNIVNHPSSQNNIISINDCVIDGFRGFGLVASNMDMLHVSGRTIEGCARNHTLLTNPANIKLTGCSRPTVSTYTEIVPSENPAANLYLDTVKDGVFTNMVVGAGSFTSGLVYLVGCNRVKLDGVFGEGIVEDANCVDCVYERVSYGGNSAGATFAGKRSTRAVITQINATHHMRAGQTLEGQMNILTNPGLEQWRSTTEPLGATAVNCSLLRTGTGEADTTKFRGRYACKVSNRIDPTNGIVWLVSDYEDATTRAAMVGEKITFSAWVNVTAGTSAIGISVYYDNGAVTDDVSPAYTIGSGWKKISESFIVRSGHVKLDIRLTLNSDTTVLYVDEASLVYGSAQTPAVADRVTEVGPYGLFVATSSATPTFDHSCAPMQSMTLTANVTGVTLANPIVGKTLTIKYVQDVTGGRTVAGWPATVRWSGGAAPVIAAAAGAISTVVLQWDGTNWFELSRVLGY